MTAGLILYMPRVPGDQLEGDRWIEYVSATCLR